MNSVRKYQVATICLMVMLAVVSLPAGRCSFVLPVRAQEKALEVGSSLPSMTFSEINGKEYRLDWPSDQALLSVFFFWVPRSVPCIFQMIDMDQIYQKNKGREVEVFAVESSGLDAARIMDTMERYQRLYPYPAYPIIQDVDLELAGTFGVQKLPLPATFFVNKDGDVVAIIKKGYRKGMDTEIQSIIDRYLSGELELTELSEPPELPEPPVQYQPKTLEEIIESSMIAYTKEEPLRVGDRVPSFEVKDISEEMHGLTRPNEEGALNIVFFWIPRSAPCIQEMIFLDQLYQQAKTFGLNVLAVESGGRNKDAIQESLAPYARIYGSPSMPLIPDPDDRLNRIYGVLGQALPITFCSNKEGRILSVLYGFHENDRKNFILKVEAFLRLPSGSLKP